MIYLILFMLISLRMPGNFVPSLPQDGVSMEVPTDLYPASPNPRPAQF